MVAHCLPCSLFFIFIYSIFIRQRDGYRLCLFRKKLTKSESLIYMYAMGVRDYNLHAEYHRSWKWNIVQYIGHHKFHLHADFHFILILRSTSILLEFFLHTAFRILQASTCSCVELENQVKMFDNNCLFQ